MGHIRQANRLMAGMGTMVGDSGIVASWKLASGHWVQRKFDMDIAHPRPMGETAVYEQHRNAYPGIAWDTRVLVYGGAYPFRFELVAGPAGMTIGETLVQSGDVLVEPANYGKLEWANPTAGNHTVTVRVYDQDYGRASNPSSYAEVTWTLAVDAANWVFIDPVNGNNANSGAIGSPFASTAAFLGMSTYADKCVMMRQGTMNLVGDYQSTNQTPGGAVHYRPTTTQPKVFVGYPGETATINCNTGHFSVTSAPGFCLRNLTVKHDGTTYTINNTSQCLMLATAGGDRLCVSDCNFPQFTLGPPSGGDNGAIVSLQPGVDISYVAFAYNHMTGIQGASVQSFRATKLVIHGNRYTGCTFSQSDASNHAVYWLKETTFSCTIRANNFGTGHTWVSELGCVGTNGQINGGDPFGCGNTEICYNTFYHPTTGSRNAAYREYTNGSVEGGLYNIHFYRNSFGIYHNCEVNVAVSITACTRENNAFDTGTWDTNRNSEYVNTNNLDGVDCLDANMKLQGSYRTSYLGTHGSEIV